MREVLFVCTHNSSRSQIAEGLVNHYSINYHAYSAGTEITSVNPYAIAVLSEIGVDITHHLNCPYILPIITFNLLLTLCPPKIQVLSPPR